MINAETFPDITKRICRHGAKYFNSILFMVNSSDRYPQHCMHVKRGSLRRISATPWMCSTVDVSERSRDCRGKIMSPTSSWWEDRDVSPIWDSANPEAEIGRSRTTIAWRQTCTCSHDLDTRIWSKNQESTTEDMADVIRKTYMEWT